MSVNPWMYFRFHGAETWVRRYWAYRGPFECPTSLTGRSSVATPCLLDQALGRRHEAREVGREPEVVARHDQVALSGVSGRLERLVERVVNRRAGRLPIVGYRDPHPLRQREALRERQARVVTPPRCEQPVAADLTERHTNVCRDPILERSRARTAPHGRLTTDRHAQDRRPVAREEDDRGARRGRCGRQRGQQQREQRREETGQTEAGPARSLAPDRGHATHQTRVRAQSSIESSTGRVVQPRVVRAFSLENHDRLPRSPTTERTLPSKSAIARIRRFGRDSSRHLLRGVAEPLAEDRRQPRPATGTGQWR